MQHRLSYVCAPVLQVKVFQQQHYLENFVQSTFNALPASDLKGIFCDAKRCSHLVLKVSTPANTLTNNTQAVLWWSLEMVDISLRQQSQSSAAWQQQTVWGRSGLAKVACCPRQLCLQSSATGMVVRLMVASS